MASLLLLIGGLIASFFHLGRPERAWRAASQWRSSWLSREVIALPLSMALILVYILLNYFGNNTVVYSLPKGEIITAAALAGVLSIIAILSLYICTAMIYACIKFLRQWHSPLTVVNFLLMGLASGFTLATLFSTHYDPQLFDYFCGFAIGLSLLALIFRYFSLYRNRKLRNTTSLQSAIGIHHPNIRQMAQGAMGGSFNTRAFIHTYGPMLVKLARWFFLLAAFLVPVLLLSISNANMLGLCLAAVLIQYLGLIVERWYFFIEAEHPQNIYYQMIS